CWSAPPACSPCTSWSSCSSGTPGGHDRPGPSPPRRRGLPVRRRPDGHPAPARVLRLPCLHAALRPVAPRHGVTVIAPRLPGHGTSWQDLETTSWHDWEREAEAALLDLAGRCTTVVAAGLSMGASLTLHLAARHPDRVAGVVAINPDLRRP